MLPMHSTPAPCWCRCSVFAEVAFTSFPSRRLISSAPWLSQRRVDQRVHHPAHHRLGLAVARAADVLEDHHGLDAVDHGEGLYQALEGLLRQLLLQWLDGEREDLGALAALERLLLEQAGLLQRL